MVHALLEGATIALLLYPQPVEPAGIVDLAYDFLLDIVLLANDGRYEEFELKKPGGRWSSEEQRILCEEHGKPIFYNLEAVMHFVRNWEQMGAMAKWKRAPRDRDET